MHFNKLFTAFLLCTMIVISSCSEDDSSPSGNVYTLTIPKGFDEHNQFMAFISDGEGNVLDKGTCAVGKSLNLYAPSNYEGLVNFHYAHRWEVTDFVQYHINTLPEVAAGFEMKLAEGTPVEWPLSHWIEVHDIPAEYKFMRHVGPTVMQKSSYVLTDPIGGKQLFYSSYSTGPITYILTHVGGRFPRYLHFSEPEPDFTFDVDFSEFVSVEPANLNVGQSVDEIFVGISALYPGGVTSSLGSITEDNTDNIDLYYYPEEVIPDFRTTLTIDKGIFHHEYIKYGGQVTEMRWLDADLTSLETTDNTVSFAANGTYSSIAMSSSENWSVGAVDYMLSWRINGGTRNTLTVVLPDIAPVLQKQWPDLNQTPVDFDYLSATKYSVSNNLGEILSVGKQF